MSRSGEQESKECIDTTSGAEDIVTTNSVHDAGQSIDATDSAEDTEDTDAASVAGGSAVADANSDIDQGIDGIRPTRAGYADETKMHRFNEQVQRNFAALDAIAASSRLSITPGGFLDRFFSATARERFAYLAILAASLSWVALFIQRQEMFETLPWCFILLLLSTFCLTHYLSEKQISLFDLLHIRTSSPFSFAESFAVSYVAFSIFLCCCLFSPGVKLKQDYVAKRQVIDIELVSHADYADKNDILPGSVPKESMKSHKNEAPIVRRSATIPAQNVQSASAVAVLTTPTASLKHSSKPQEMTAAAPKLAVVREAGKTDNFAMKIAEQPRLGTASNSENQASRRSRSQPVLEEVAPPEMVEITDNQGDNGSESWQPGGHSTGGNGRKNQLVSYLKELHRRIKHAWTPPGGEARKAEILFRIKRNGSLASIKLVNSSGDSDADESAMHAIATCSPFQPLPNDFPNAYLDLQYTFNYSVDELSEVVKGDSWQ